MDDPQLVNDLGDWAKVAAYEYPRVEIALLTGWTLEYIDGLGMIDADALLQIVEAKQDLQKGK